MRSITLGRSSLRCSVLSYGCMRIAGTWNPAEIDATRAAAAKRMLATAIDAGYTLFDHADIYCRGGCEDLFGQFFAENRALRDRLVIATKCAIRFGGDPQPASPHRYDFSADHIAWSVEQSLRRLRIETIDLYQLHRPDILMDPHEIAEAFERLRRAGKAREFGVSNFVPSTLAALQAHLPFPLIVNQVEIHPGRLDCFVDGTLDQCVERRITPLSWSPLGRGTFGDKPLPGDAAAPLRALIDALDQTARELGVSRQVATLAWLLKHPSGIVPIVGTCNLDRIRDAASAADVDLSREQWYRIYVAARGKALP